MVDVGPRGAVLEDMDIDNGVRDIDWDQLRGWVHARVCMKVCGCVEIQVCVYALFRMEV